MAWQDELSGPGRSAAGALIDLFEQYGLGSLAGKIVSYIKEGYDQDTTYLLLQDTSEWKQRFIGNERRRKAGLSVLSPSEYISVERGYRQALQAQGMPNSFYDSNSDFAHWMELDVSPEEIAERAQAARRVTDQVDPEQRRALRGYGIDSGELAAYYLDADRALPILQKRVDTAMLDAERRRAGFGYSKSQAERLYDQGITVDQAREGYSTIASEMPTLARLADLDGANYGLEEAQRATFEQDAEANRTRSRLISNEAARFSGAGGQSSATFSGDDTFN